MKWLLLCLFLCSACFSSTPEYSPKILPNMVQRHVNATADQCTFISQALENKDSSALWEHTEYLRMIALSLADSLAIFPYADSSGFINAANDFLQVSLFLAEKLAPKYIYLFPEESDPAYINEIKQKNDSLSVHWEQAILKLAQKRPVFINTQNWILLQD
jgi:hypothetical protein